LLTILFGLAVVSVASLSGSVGQPWLVGFVHDDDGFGRMTASTRSITPGRVVARANLGGSAPNHRARLPGPAVPLCKYAELHEKKMNKQIELISTGKARAIAEDCGWTLGPTHQILEEFARKGRLRSWGYKGNSSELTLIDPFIWQDHGLDILNEQLIVPKKFLASDYAEQTWRDVHWDRREIEAAFPPYPLMQTGSDPATPRPGETGEAGCREWLMQQMRESPGQRQKSKQAYADEAKQLFGIGPRAFNRIWDAAVEGTRAFAWKRPGRPRKNHNAVSIRPS
jgi:hypothetical protein